MYGYSKSSSSQFDTIEVDQGEQEYGNLSFSIVDQPETRELFNFLSPKTAYFEGNAHEGFEEEICSRRKYKARRTIGLYEINQNHVFALLQRFM
jgi:hypothetical protein